MDDTERLAILQYADDHQFDEDENADLVIDNDDPVIQAAVRLMNRFGGYHELTLAPSVDLIEAIHIVGLR